MKPLHSFLVLLSLVTFALPASAQSGQPETHLVVVHMAGPEWNPALSAFEQPWITEAPEGKGTHVAYYRTLLERGDLERGGPFLSGGVTEGMPVGLMIAKGDIDEEALSSFAAEDPAVKAGVLTFRVANWLIGMKAE